MNIIALTVVKNKFVCRQKNSPGHKAGAIKIRGDYLRTVNISIPLEEWSEFIQSKISDDNKALTNGCVWVPMMIELNRDGEIDMVSVAAKRGEPITRRFRINREVLCEQ